MQQCSSAAEESSFCPDAPWPSGKTTLVKLIMGALEPTVVRLSHTHHLAPVSGKTTLVKLMTGALEPTEGEIRRNGQCRIAIVNQHHADQIDLQVFPR